MYINIINFYDQFTNCKTKKKEREGEMYLETNIFPYK